MIFIKTKWPRRQNEARYYLRLRVKKCSNPISNHAKGIICIRKLSISLRKHQPLTTEKQQGGGSAISNVFLWHEPSHSQVRDPPCL